MPGSRGTNQTPPRDAPRDGAARTGKRPPPPPEQFVLSEDKQVDSEGEDILKYYLHCIVPSLFI